MPDRDHGHRHHHPHRHGGRCGHHLLLRVKASNALGEVWRTRTRPAGPPPSGSHNTSARRRTITATVTNTLAATTELLGPERQISPCERGGKPPADLRASRNLTSRLQNVASKGVLPSLRSARKGPGPPTRCERPNCGRATTFGPRNATGAHPSKRRDVSTGPALAAPSSVGSFI